MTKSVIRKATTDDAQMLSELAAMTFWDAYRGESKLENQYLKAYIDSAFNLGQIETEIKEKTTIFLLSENQNGQIGYAKLKVGSRRPEIKFENPVEISRLYLNNACIGQGYGGELLNQCIDEGKQRNCGAVWLSVWEHNKKAIRFYKKYGFTNVGQHIFDLAGSKQTDVLMLRPL